MGFITVRRDVWKGDLKVRVETHCIESNAGVDTVLDGYELQEEIRVVDTRHRQEGSGADEERENERENSHSPQRSQNIRCILGEDLDIIKCASTLPQHQRISRFYEHICDKEENADEYRADTDTVVEAERSIEKPVEHDRMDRSSDRCALCFITHVQ